MGLATKTYTDINFQVLSDVVKGVFAQKDAFMGSLLVSSGAVVVNSSMPAKGPDIGTTITVPYFGTIGDFDDNDTDGDSLTPVGIEQTNEEATVRRKGKAIEGTRWASGNATPDGDPYKEMAEQLKVGVTRAIDASIIPVAHQSPHVYDRYNASNPQYLTPSFVANARQTIWGDQGADRVVGMLCHSRTVAGLRSLTDKNGNPQLIDDLVNGYPVTRFMGLPIVESDKAPIVGTMGTVVSVGTGSEPTLTLAGTPLDLWQLRIRKFSATTTLGAGCTVQFSTDGGNIWSEPVAIPDTDPVAMIDPATDSMVGNNGRTGLTMAFSGNFSNQDNVYGSNATAKVSTLILKAQSCAYWYNGSALEFKTDENILKDSKFGAMHLYYCAHRYRRVPYGTKGGVGVLKHNVYNEDVTAASLQALAYSP